MYSKIWCACPFFRSEPKLVVITKPIGVIKNKYSFLNLASQITTYQMNTVTSFNKSNEALHLFEIDSQMTYFDLLTQTDAIIELQTEMLRFDRESMVVNAIS